MFLLKNCECFYTANYWHGGNYFKTIQQCRAIFTTFENSWGFNKSWGFL